MTAASDTAAPLPQTRLMVLMFTDLVGSVSLKTELGAAAYANLISRHDAMFKRIIADTPGSAIINDTGDGFLAKFPTAMDGVAAALRFQHELRHEKWEPKPLEVRIGLHIGQVAELDADETTGLRKLVGLAADMAARVMDLAQGGQILMTRTCFDDARQYVRKHPSVPGVDDDALPPLRWMAHGPYLFKGSDEPMDVFEVGADGVAPLTEPPDSNKARRAVKPGDEELLGWRPAIGLTIPGREGWTLQRKLGEGGFGEVWLGRHEKMRTRRVFKFCYDADRLRSFKREMTLFRLLRTALGERKDIATIYEVRLDRPPFFLESAYSEHGDLSARMKANGGAAARPLEERLELVAGAADAVAAAHSVGILHKDIKPSNVLIELNDDGSPRPVLADFGIGIIGDRTALDAANITVAGFTETIIDPNDSSRTGTRMYAPPELLAGKPFTTQGDVYALGVFLYQMVIGDLSRPLAQGWESDVDDELLRQDIAACVAGEPSQRLGGAAELAERLRTLGQRRAARRREAAAAAAAQKRRVMVRAAAIAVVLLAAGAVVFGIMFARESSLRQDAEDATQEANRQRLAAEAAEGRALAAAQPALRSNDVIEARRQLDAAPAALRGWEWQHLLRRVDQSLMTFSPDDRAARIIGAGGADSPTGDTPLPGGPAKMVAFSPDGAALAAGYANGVVVIHDLMQPGRSQRFRAHEYGLNYIGYTPDGQTLITSGNDKRICQWAAPDWTLHGSVTLESEPRILCANADASLLAIRIGFDALRVQPPGGGRRVYDVPARLYADTAAFSPDGRLFAYNDGSSVIVIDLESGQKAATFTAHGADVVRIMFDPEGRGRIISVDEDGLFHAWSTDTAASSGAYRFPRSGVDLTAASVSVSAEMFVACFEDGGILAVFDNDMDNVTTFYGHTDAINAIAFHPTRADLFATASDDGAVKLWSSLSRDQSTVLDANSPDMLATARDAPRAVVASSGYIELWDLDLADQVMHWPDPYVEGDRQRSWVRCAAISDDGRLIATGHGGGRVAVWDRDAARQHVASFQAGDVIIIAVAFIERDKILAACTLDGAIHRFDLSNRRSLGHVRTNAATVYEWKRVNPQTGQVEASWRIPMDQLPWAVFSHDRRLLATPGGFAPVKLWDAATGQIVRTLGGDDVDAIVEALDREGKDRDPARAVAFSPDDRLLAVGTEFGAVEWWDLRSGRRVFRSEAHTKEVEGLAFSPDGSRLASASDDQTVRICDVRSGQQVAVLRYKDLDARQIAFDSTGKRLLLGVDEDVLVLDVDPLGPRLDAMKRWLGLKEMVTPAVAAHYKALTARSAVFAAIRKDASLDEPSREAALRVAQRVPVDATMLWINSWKTFSSPDLPQADYAKAIADLEAAIEERPAVAEYRAGMAVLLYRLGRTQDALTLATFALSMNRDLLSGESATSMQNVCGEFCLVACNVKLKKLDEARQAGQRLQQLRNDPKARWFGVPLALYEEAMKMLEAAGGAP